MEQKKQKKLIISLVIIIILLGTISLLGMVIKSKGESLKQKEKNSKKIQKPLTNVITMEIIPCPVQEVINLPGQAIPWKSLIIVTEVRGKVITKKITEGSPVKTGDVLAIIDKRDYENSYNAAKASYKTLLTTEKRLIALKKKKFITQSQVDDVTATLKQAKARMDNAMLNLLRCTIKAPMDGIIDKVFIEQGSFLDPGKPVAKILQINKIKIEVGIPESDIDIVRNIDEFDIEIDALNSRHFLGKRYYLHKTTDDFARLYNLEISVDNFEKKILPGMFARVKITKHYIKDGLAVPMYALVNKNGNDGVYVVKNGIAFFKKVEKGFLDQWRIQIKKGLNPHDKVVVMGQRLISNKEKVKITKNVLTMEELSK